MGNTIREIAAKLVFKTGDEKLVKNQIKTFFDFSYKDIDGKLVKYKIQMIIYL